MENIVVIGGGLMGSSAAWKLSDRGAKILLIEQQSEQYTTGSSYGVVRISRSLGPKKDVFSYIHNQTIKEVSELLSYLNKNDHNTRHKMEDIYSTSPVSYLFPKNQYDKINKFRYKKQKNDYRRGSGNSAFRKFGMTIPDDTVLIREMRPYTGTINPTELISKLRIAIRSKGNAILFNAKVEKLIKKEDYFEIAVTDAKSNETRVIKTKQVVLAAGPYITSLLKDFAPYFNRVITPKRVVLSFFKITEDRYQKLTPEEKKSIQESQPFFSQIGKEYFSMISESDKDKSPTFKAGGHQMRRNIRHLDRVWTEQPRKKELKWIKKQFRKHFEMLEIYLRKKDIVQVDSYNCVYSETRTKVPIVSNIFNKYGSLDRDIVVVGGMSGIGAKGSLGYGAIAADLLLGKEGKSKKMYRKVVKAFGNPSVRLYTRRIRNGRLF